MSGLLEVWGDSFAEEELIAYPPGHPAHEHYRKHRSWHSILRQIGKWSKIVVYARGGSDMWSQLRDFKRNTHHSDVLWFETHPGRLTSPCGIFLANLTNIEHRIVEHTVGFYKNNPNNDHTLKVLRAARDYYIHLQDINYDRWAQAEMIDEIRRLAPHTRFIPCFQDCITRDCASGPLIDATIAEQSRFQDLLSEGKMWDLRRNHMCERNHVNLAHAIMRAWSTGESFQWGNWAPATEQDRVDYWLAT